jgi:hypothetical protein
VARSSADKGRRSRRMLVNRQFGTFLFLLFGESERRGFTLYRQKKSPKRAFRKARGHFLMDLPHFFEMALPEFFPATAGTEPMTFDLFVTNAFEVPQHGGFVLCIEPLSIGFDEPLNRMRSLTERPWLSSLYQRLADEVVSNRAI